MFDSSIPSTKLKSAKPKGKTQLFYDKEIDRVSVFTSWRYSVYTLTSRLISEHDQTADSEPDQQFTRYIGLKPVSSQSIFGFLGHL